MTIRRRRRDATVLLGLLSLQALAGPVAACAQPHGGHAPTPIMGMTQGIVTPSSSDAHGPAADAHAAGEAEHETDPMPSDCRALQVCGTPALRAGSVLSHLVLPGDFARAGMVVQERPIAVVLGLVTPPPKI